MEKYTDTLPPQPLTNNSACCYPKNAIENHQTGKLVLLESWDTGGRMSRALLLMMDVQQNLDSEKTLYDILVLRWRFNFSIAVHFIICNATQNTNEEDPIAFLHVRRMLRQGSKGKLNCRADFMIINLNSFFCNAIHPTIQNLLKQPPKPKSLIWNSSIRDLFWPII